MTSYISGEKFIRWNKTDFIHTTVQLSQRLVCVILVLSTFLIYLYWLHQLKYHIYTLIRSVSIYSLITLRSWNVTKQSLINFFLQKFEGDVRTNVIIHLYVTVICYRGELHKYDGSSLRGQLGLWPFWCSPIPVLFFCNID